MGDTGVFQVVLKGLLFNVKLSFAANALLANLVDGVWHVTGITNGEISAQVENNEASVISVESAGKSVDVPASSISEPQPVTVKSGDELIYTATSLNQENPEVMNIKFD